MNKRVMLMIIVLLFPISVSAGDGDAGGTNGPMVVLVEPVPLPVTGEATVNNTEESPVPVKIMTNEEADIPFQGVMSVQYSDMTPAGSVNYLDPTPPPGRILTIRYVSASCSYYQLEDHANNIVNHEPTIRVTFQGKRMNHGVGFRSEDNYKGEGWNGFSVSQQTLIFADTDEPIEPRDVRYVIGPHIGDQDVLDVTTCYFKITGYHRPK